MVLESFCEFFHLQPNFKIELPAVELVSDFDADACQLHKYNPLVDTEALKSHPELFEHLRGDYSLRRE